MTIRSLIFWLHLTAGVVAGTVVLVMSVTGVLLTYEKQMVAWAERSPLAAPPAPDAPRLSIDALDGEGARGAAGGDPGDADVPCEPRRTGDRRAGP